VKKNLPPNREGLCIPSHKRFGFSGRFKWSGPQVDEGEKTVKGRRKRQNPYKEREPLSSGRGHLKSDKKLIR